MYHESRDANEDSAIFFFKLLLKLKSWFFFQKRNVKTCMDKLHATSFGINLLNLLCSTIAYGDFKTLSTLTNILLEIIL